MEGEDGKERRESLHLQHCIMENNNNAVRVSSWQSKQISHITDYTKHIT